LSGRVVVKSKALQAVAKQFAADYEVMFGQKLTLVGGKAKKGDIVLTLKKLDTMPSEGYQMTIGDVVEVASPAEIGTFWATRTLLQILEIQSSNSPLSVGRGVGGEAFKLPQGTITDIPQYKMRGFMLDVGRKFVPMSYLRNLVKVMAYYKMNTLQLHLNDNGFPQYFENDWMKTSAAFRLECDTYPGLAAKDGHYTKAEFIELQKLAESLHVEIIPEIDAPAHVLAFTQYRPELGSKEYGMDHFNLSNPDIYTFMDGLFAEYLTGKNPVFRGPRVNIGTDEYSNRDKAVVEQFRAYTDYYLDLIEKYGKQPMVWGSLTHAKGKTPIRHENVLMACWSTDYAQPDSMMKIGYQIVSIPDRYTYIVPAAGYYYDYLNCKYLYESWTPATLFGKPVAEQHPQLEGGMFAVWNDHYGNGISTKDIHHRLYPAMHTFSTKCWTGQLTSLPYEIFDQKRLALSEAPAVNELARLPENPVKLAVVEAGKPLNLRTPSSHSPLSVGRGAGGEAPIFEAGYDYAVSFDIDCAAEAKGTILTTGENATFYLADPETGRLAFSRDGDLNKFNYKLPETGQVSLRIEGNNAETRLFVNNRHRETLRKRDAYSVGEPLNTMPDAPYHTTVYVPTRRMFYVATLVFPLEKAGNFNSKITNLEVRKL
ncbi:MAG: family 20 glycosylhydrolase, partial [Muribaculaceae bacterium]|nr:family 20 glycosylhydrolase [Muribaculaceae bacterium]